MGKRRHKRGGPRGGGGGDKRMRSEDGSARPAVVEGQGIRGTWKKLPESSALFDQYYQLQQLIPPHEWELFLRTCRTILPVSFRLSPVPPGVAAQIVSELKTRLIPEMVAASETTATATLDDESCAAAPASGATDAAMATSGDVVGLPLPPAPPPPPPQPLPWFPNELAWQYDVGKRELKRTPAFTRFHNFIHILNESGQVSRQETVSMIPPMLLDIQSHHYVLDMCAAPGQKTAQLVEFLRAAAPPNQQPSGCVVANDADWRRCHLLCHQLQRQMSPYFMVTNCEAQHFPALLVPSEEASRNPLGVPADEQYTKLKFDRILCDVPCTGDGTMRKQREIWQKWRATNGIHLHHIQFLIAQRAVELLRPGGLMVYSTCSLNPVEDEAVVAGLLLKYPSCLELVDCSQMFPELRRAPGVHSWVTTDATNTPITWTDVVETNKQNMYAPTMFAPSREVAAALHLERCLRLIPHLQNTGGFFVALLRKTAEVPIVEQPLSKKMQREAHAAAAAALAPAAMSVSGDNDNNDNNNDNNDDDDDNNNNNNDNDGPPPPAVCAPMAMDVDAEPEAAGGDAAAVEAAPARALDMSVKPLRGKGNWGPRPRGGRGRGPPSSGAGQTGHAPEGRIGAACEDPFFFVNVATSTVAPWLINTFGLNERFPHRQLMRRSQLEKKGYFVCAGARRLLLARNVHKLKLINTGVRVWDTNEAADYDQHYRIVQDGLPFISEYMTQRNVATPRDLFVLLLQKGTLPLTEIATFDPEIHQTLSTLTTGSFALHVVGRPEVCVAAWLGRSTIRLFTQLAERRMLLFCHFGVMFDLDSTRVSNAKSGSSGVYDQDLVPATTTTTTTTSSFSSASTTTTST